MPTWFPCFLNCYIPIFYFKLCPKFPFLFHTPMFLMSSYSILWCFQHFQHFLTFSILWCFPIPHSDISDLSHSLLTSFRTPMFSLLWHFWNPPVPFHAPTFSDVFRCFPYFYRCGTFSELLWAHYHHGTLSVTSRTLFPKHHNLRSIMDSLWMQ